MWGLGFRLAVYGLQEQRSEVWSCSLRLHLFGPWASFVLSGALL